MWRVAGPSGGPPRRPVLWGPRAKRKEGPGGNVEEPVALGRPECLRPTAPSVRGLSARASLRCRRRGAAGAVGAGGFRLPSRLRQLRLSPREEGLPSGRPGGSQRANEPRALCWRRRDWRARRRLLAPQRRPGQTLLGTLKNFSRSQTCRKFEGKPRPRAIPSQIPVRGASEGSQLPFQTALGQRRGEAGEGGGHPGTLFGLRGELAETRGLLQPPAPAQWRDCTCRRPPRCSLGGEARPEKNLTTVAGRRTWLLLGGGGN